MPAAQQPFGQHGLTRLATPEQLDGLIRVVDAPGWIALAAAVMLILAGIAWSAFGTVRITVSGDGLLQLENLHSIEIKAVLKGTYRRLSRLPPTTTVACKYTPTTKTCSSKC